LMDPGALLESGHAGPKARSSMGLLSRRFCWSLALAGVICAALAAASAVAAPAEPAKKPAAAPAHPAAKKTAKKAVPHAARVVRNAPLPRKRPVVAAPVQAKIAPAAAPPAVPMPPVARAAPVPFAAARSDVTSPADMAALKRALEAARKGKDADADAAEMSIADPVARKLAEWAILRFDNTNPGFRRYAEFANANPTWPHVGLFRRRAEAAL